MAKKEMEEGTAMNPQQEKLKSSASCHVED